MSLSIYTRFNYIVLHMDTIAFHADIHCPDADGTGVSAFDLMHMSLRYITVLIVHRIVLFWEPDRCFQDGGQENRREVGTYSITISSVY